MQKKKLKRKVLQIEKNIKENKESVAGKKREEEEKE